MKNFKQYFPFIWYYIGWFGCVYLGKYGFSNWSFFFPLFLITLLLVWRKLNLRVTGLLILVAVLGMTFDAVMAAKGWIVFVDPDYVILPYWLISIWLLFLFVIPIMVSSLYSRLWLAAVLGAVFGPLSYASGSVMGVLSFQGSISIYLYSGFWGFYFPLSIYVVGKGLMIKKEPKSSNVRGSF